MRKRRKALKENLWSVRLGLRGREFFKTGDGFFGVCPESTDYGDIIVVVLGVPSPLVVRPIQHSRRCAIVLLGRVICLAQCAKSVYEVNFQLAGV